MNILRRAHLYLGCFFAPMLLFFAVSGTWQVLGWQDARDPSGKRTPSALLLSYISSIHTGHRFKSGHDLTSAWLQGFVLLMALSLAVTILLGLVLSFKYGRGALATLCLLGGIIVPAGLIWAFHS